MPVAEQTRERAPRLPGTRSLRARLRPRGLVACALVAVGLGHLTLHAAYTLDDAYITFRYARSLASGLGLVYNPGDHVKGYSNTLYTLVMTLPELARRDPLGFSKAIGALSFGWLCWLGYRLYAREATAGLRDRALCLLALLATSSALAVHFIGGLETGLHTVLVFAAVLQRVREQDDAAQASPAGPPRAPAWSALLFAAVIWSRPEGILIFAAAALHDLLWRATTRRFAAQDLGFYLAPLVAYAGELAWSDWYYGAPFPQTYYAKAGATRGLLDSLHVLLRGLLSQLSPASYLARGAASIALGWAGWLILPLAFATRARRRRNLALLLALLAQLVFVVRAGDDWAPAFRFGVPLIPLFAVLLVEALGTAAALARRYQRALFALLAVSSVVLSLPRQWRESQRIRAEQPVNARNKLAQGRSFAALAAPGVTLSSFDIGGQGYAAGGFDILDTVGLTVRETTGCRDRMLARCVRYAELVAPELVRLHNNKRRDAYVSRSVRRVGPYLELDAGKLLLARQLVLPPELPERARAREPLAYHGAQLVAEDLPAALRVAAVSQLGLYWTRGSELPGPLLARRLEWRGAGGHYGAGASQPVWQRAGTLAAWPADALFQDLVSVQAPPRAGRYALELVVAAQRYPLAQIDVLEPASARAEAARTAATARAAWQRGQALAAFALWGRALELSDAAGAEYHAAVARHAGAQRAHAEALVPSDRLGALRLAQDAKRLLHQAYWEAGRASPALHREIEANAALRRALIDAELGTR